MYQPFLFIHWKTVRLALIPLIAGAFALPLLSVQGLGTPPGASGATLEVYTLVARTEWVLPLFPALAAAIGIILGLSAWHWDHNLGHVYALSLPVARWRYALSKLGAGAVLAMLPAGALGLGAALAASMVSLPPGLHAYVAPLTVRFLFGTLVVYALLFSLASGTVRTTVVVLTALVALPLLGDVLFGLLSHIWPQLQGIELTRWLWEWLAGARGPFEVFFGNWTWIDV